MERGEDRGGVQALSTLLVLWWRTLGILSSFTVRIVQLSLGKIPHMMRAIVIVCHATLTGLLRTTCTGAICTVM